MGIPFEKTGSRIKSGMTQSAKSLLKLKTNANALNLITVGRITPHVSLSSGERGG
jgi:hypothetical protein